jgi:hypothetical protein
MKRQDIMARLGDEDYVAKIIIRGDPESLLSDDETLATQQRAARVIVRQMIVVRRTTGFKQSMEKTRLSDLLRDYVNTYVDNP